MMLHKENRPAGNGAESSPDDTPKGNLYLSLICRQLRARRAASYRLPVLECGRSDPWHYRPPGAAGYEDAALHLLELGLTPAPNRDGLMAIWRRGGHSRQAAEFIADAWELAS
jgi:hypothetical protein